MNSKKLKLSELKVESFVTLPQAESDKVKAGYVLTRLLCPTYPPEICTKDPNIACI